MTRERANFRSKLEGEAKVRVLVLGAGVVGVAAAYHLAKAGHAVTVIDRQPGPGLETSFANGGQISASHAEPWANPHAPLLALRWLGRRDAPLRLLPRFDAGLIGWLGRFLVNCAPSRTAENIERTLRVALYSRAVLGALRAELGLEYDQRCAGILHVYRDPRAFDQACAAARTMEAHGLERRTLNPQGCVDIEPALAEARDQLAGGLFSPDDESGDAHRFTQALAEAAAKLGVAFLYDTPIRAILAEGGTFRAVVTATAMLDAEAAVVALGSYSPLLLGPLGLHLPIQPAKGYSVTMSAGAGAPHVSLTDDERRLVFSRLGDRLRVAGTAELVGYDTHLDQERAKLVLKGALDLFPRGGDPAQAQFWCGLRPKTPDSVPIIGATPIRGLYLDTGHGTLGWTMACGSGRLIADLVSGKKPEIDPHGLGLDRF